MISKSAGIEFYMFDIDPGSYEQENVNERICIEWLILLSRFLSVSGPFGTENFFETILFINLNSLLKNKKFEARRKEKTPNFSICGKCVIIGASPSVRVYSGETIILIF